MTKASGDTRGSPASCTAKVTVNSVVGCHGSINGCLHGHSSQSLPGVPIWPHSPVDQGGWCHQRLPAREPQSLQDLTLPAALRLNVYWPTTPDSLECGVTRDMHSRRLVRSLPAREMFSSRPFTSRVVGMPCKIPFASMGTFCVTCMP